MSSALFARLRELNLPTGDYAIFGSGPLAVRGLIESSDDLDVVCRRRAWEYVQTLGVVEYLADYDVSIVSLDDGRLTFGDRWGIGDFDVDQLIDEAEILDELPFVPLRHVIRYKQLRNSAKDRAHLESIARYQKTGG